MATRLCYLFGGDALVIYSLSTVPLTLLWEVSAPAAESRHRRWPGWTASVHAASETWKLEPAVLFQCLTGGIISHGPLLNGHPHYNGKHLHLS